MNICIDTNAYSAFKRGDPSIVNLFEIAVTITIPTVVIGELYAGFISVIKPVEMSTSYTNF